AEISEKEDFLRAVSHDLNAPLRNISGMASMLILKYKDTMEKDALQRLERIQKNVQVECELINELLELSRIKSRREKIERVDLHELVTMVAEGFSNDLETDPHAADVPEPDRQRDQVHAGGQPEGNPDWIQVGGERGAFLGEGHGD